MKMCNFPMIGGAKNETMEQKADNKKPNYFGKKVSLSQNEGHRFFQLPEDKLGPGLWSCRDLQNSPFKFTVKTLRTKGSNNVKVI